MKFHHMLANLTVETKAQAKSILIAGLYFLLIYNTSIKYLHK